MVALNIKSIVGFAVGALVLFTLLPLIVQNFSSVVGNLTGFTGVAGLVVTLVPVAFMVGLLIFFLNMWGGKN